MSYLCVERITLPCQLVTYVYPTWNVHALFQVLPSAADAGTGSEPHSLYRRKSHMREGGSADTAAAVPDSPASETADCARHVKQERGFAADEQATGQVWRLSRDPEGCRKVQDALETAKSDEERAAIAAELRGHVWEAVRCPNANHVIQKCIIMLRPRAAQFIIDEIMSGTIVFQAVRHRYGCRVVQRLLEQCMPDQVQGLAQAILSDVYWLSRHPYGNYVMQSLLEHGTDLQRQRAVEPVAANVGNLVSDTHGCSVVSACLFHGPDEGKALLAHAISQEPGIVERMSRTRHGRSAAKIAQELLRQPQGTAGRKEKPRRAARRRATEPAPR